MWADNNDNERDLIRPVWAAVITAALFNILLWALIIWGIVKVVQAFTG